MKVANICLIYEGWWTRVNNKNSSERSVIDYLLLNEKYEPNFKKLLIEESITTCPYKVTNKKR